MIPDGQPALSLQQQLSTVDLAAIRTLAELCNRYDDLDMKLNWDMLEQRPGTASDDLLFHQDGALIGYLGLYGFGRPTLELSGMVHPNYRRRAVFRRLYEAARAEAVARKIESLLLICEPGSTGGNAFVRAIGASHVFSEHKMVIARPAPVPTGPATITLEPAGPANARIVARIRAQSFAQSDAEAEQWTGQYIEQPGRHAYLARLDREPVGTIAVQTSPDEHFIYGFGVVPEQRGRGYGRQILAATINLLGQQSTRPVMLEVETQNQRALGLYESCGFRRVRTYDYWEVPLVR